MKLVLIAFALCAGALAHADNIIVADYGVPVNLPHCGGTATLVCPDQTDAKVRDLCEVRFSGVSCQDVKMYVGRDFYPTSDTFQSQIQSSFFVDHNKLSTGYVFGKGYINYVNVYVNTSTNDNTDYDKIQFQFNY